MSKFYGIVGFVYPEETFKGSGVYRNKIVERKYSGDVQNNIRRWDSKNEVNEDINISNTISIIADPFAYEKIGWIRYIEYIGFKWKVVSIQNSYPRLIINVSGVYSNGQ